jgi:hypothetical protein
VPQKEDEMSEALIYANALEVSDKNPALINVNNRAAAELRRLHALNAELVEALRWIEGVNAMESEYKEKARAALAKVGGTNV